MQDPHADHAERPHFLFDSSLLERDVVESLIKAVLEQKELQILLNGGGDGTNTSDAADITTMAALLESITNDTCSYVSYN